MAVWTETWPDTDLTRKWAVFYPDPDVVDAVSAGTLVSTLPAGYNIFRSMTAYKNGDIYDENFPLTEAGHGIYWSVFGPTSTLTEYFSTEFMVYGSLGIVLNWVDQTYEIFIAGPNPHLPLDSTKNHYRVLYDGTDSLVFSRSADGVTGWEVLHSEYAGGFAPSLTFSYAVLHYESGGAPADYTDTVTFGPVTIIYNGPAPVTSTASARWDNARLNLVGVATGTRTAFSPVT